MADVSNVTGAPVNTAAGSATSTGNIKISPADFLNLYTTQLKFQDPSKPMDSSAMLQNMASLASLTSSTNMQQRMDDLANTMQTTLGNSQVLEATQLIGRKVEMQSGISPLTTNADGTATLSGSAAVPAAASSVTVTISDPTGSRVVKTLNLGGASASGLLDFKWDGKDDTGKQLDPGYYKISASATIAGKATPIETAGAFDVKSVALGSGGVILNLDGLGGQNMGNVIKIL